MLISLHTVYCSRKQTNTRNIAHDQKQTKKQTLLHDFSSDDHMSPPPTMPTSNYMQSGVHMSPTHIHNQQAYHQSHYSSGTITPLLHTTHPQTHLMGHNPSASMSNIPVSVSVNPMPIPTSRSTTPASGYPDELYAPHDFNDMSQSEHYIYVTYPPELKRRLLERYGREIYLMLLKKDFHD